MLASEPNEEKESGFNFTINILHQRNMYKMTDEKYPFLNNDTNFIFMFSPNEKAEILIQ